MVPCGGTVRGSIPRGGIGLNREEVQLLQFDSERTEVPKISLKFLGPRRGV